MNTPLHPEKNRIEAMDTLARTLWGEARGEGRQGMIAVANVIMNRVRRGGWWGRTVTSVCLKDRQFSCWNHDDPNRQKLLMVQASDPAFATALEIADLAVDGELPDITAGATHYHADTIKPGWAAEMTQTAEIGRHLFYWEG